MKLAELDNELEKNQLSGFWKTRVPSHSSEAPYLWKWEPLLDGLLKASETIGIEQAERRAIRLVSPHLPHQVDFSYVFKLRFLSSIRARWRGRTVITWRRSDSLSRGKGRTLQSKAKNFPWKRAT